MIRQAHKDGKIPIAKQWYSRSGTRSITKNKDKTNLHPQQVDLGVNQELLVDVVGTNIHCSRYYL